MLNINNAVALATLVTGCQRGSKVKWTYDEGETVLEGDLRSLCDVNDGFLGADADVLTDGYVRITGRDVLATEHRVSVARCLVLLSKHEMVVDPS